LKITQKELKKYICYDQSTGEILKRNLKTKDPNVWERLHISYDCIGSPYTYINKRRYMLLKLLVLYVEGFAPVKCKFIDGDNTNFLYNNIFYEPLDRKVTYEYVRQIFNYDPETGVLTRRIKGGRTPKGAEVGYIDKKYRHKTVSIFSHNYYLHRIIWL